MGFWFWFREGDWFAEPIINFAVGVSWAEDIETKVNTDSLVAFLFFWALDSSACRGWGWGNNFVLATVIHAVLAWKTVVGQNAVSFHGNAEPIITGGIIRAFDGSAGINHSALIIKTLTVRSTVFRGHSAARNVIVILNVVSGQSAGFTSLRVVKQLACNGHGANELIRRRHEECWWAFLEGGHPERTVLPLDLRGGRAAEEVKLPVTDPRFTSVKRIIAFDAIAGEFNAGSIFTDLVGWALGAQGALWWWRRNINTESIFTFLVSSTGHFVTRRVREAVAVLTVESLGTVSIETCAWP